MATHKFHHSSTPTPLPNGIRDSLHVHHQHLHSRRSVSTNGRIAAHSARLMTSVEGDLGTEEDPKLSIFKELYHKSESRLASLFDNSSRDTAGDRTDASLENSEQNVVDTQGTPAHGEPPTKKLKRTIDEDDYDDSDGEDEEASVNESPLKGKSTGPALALSSTPMFRALSSSSTPATSMKGTSSLEGGKTTEAARKKLEEDKKATEEAAKRNFLTLFYTLENDRDAMLEQKRLEESERQVEVELGHGSGGANADGSAHNSGQTGTLSQTNLGASSLTLKNLIKRIDDQRNKVKSNDTELRALISEVRKNRSKWASEEKVGQEELYEAAEKVLNELKAMTEHSGPFLTKVGKKDAPDYHLTIKHPMDLGSMTKKLKGTQYKSKQEFVDDLNLIWANCLKFNADPNHFLRRHALFMRKETEKLVPLIPNIVIRDRADVEAEERRLHANLEGEEDSDDEPIMSSRGRKAPGKKSKKGTVARKAPAGEDGSPDSEVKPPAGAGLGAAGPHIKRDPSRGESEHTGERHTTDPPGTLTPAGVNGAFPHGAGGNQSESMDLDGESMVNGVLPSTDMDHESENDDEEYKTWKQVTKKDRALITAERHRLFKGEALDPEATALLRTKAGMRRWIRQQKEAVVGGGSISKDAEAETTKDTAAAPSGETLAEGMEGDEERVVPDYYDPLAAIPDVPTRLRWVEDSEGRVQDHSEEFLRILPKGLFLAPESQMATKINDNLHEIQKTQKLTSKIGVVKQMQLQSQMYQGQFQKHEIIPFVEQDVQPHVMLDDGPVIAPNVCRAALQRTVAKLLVHAGFDETQPAAIDAITDMAGDYFTKIARTLNNYSQAPPVPVPSSSEPCGVEWKQRFSVEESILHSLQENGADLDALDSYVTEDIERTGTRLSKTHDSMKSHLAELLRPALTDAGPDGSNAFNDDSEQFIGGDFAEELGEDFFGFKELGLDAEFGGASLSVPLHLLKSRMYNANQTQNASATSSNLPSTLPPPAPFTPITPVTVKNQIGLVQQFFLDKLKKNHDNPLVEDDDLPQKQRFPKPRLPPTGKITSPRKRPIKEPGPGKGHPKKKMKLNDGEAKEVATDSSKLVNGTKESETTKDTEKGSSSDKKGATESSKPLTNGVAASPKSLPQQAGKEKTGMATPKNKEKLINGETGGMISPESLEANGT